MLFWLGLVAGLILGWLIEWVIDWRFWRRSAYSALEVENRWRDELVAARQEISRLQAQLAELTWPAKETTAEVVQRDPLEQIAGIGPLYAQRLHEAGIFTFAQLAAATPSTVRAAIETVESQQDPAESLQVEAETWIAQAKTLATHSESAE